MSFILLFWTLFIFYYQFCVYGKQQYIKITCCYASQNRENTESADSHRVCALMRYVYKTPTIFIKCSYELHVAKSAIFSMDITLHLWFCSVLCPQV